jgi:hypothetical protein
MNNKSNTFMNFRKQIQFSRLIKADGRLKEFNFLKIFGVNIPTYCVDVGDEHGIRYIFSLFNDGKCWKISGEDLPEWVIEAESKLKGEVVAQEVATQ